MIRFIIGIVLGVFVILFMAQNAQSTSITILAWTFELSRAVMFLIIYVFGFLSGFLIMGIRRIKKRGVRK
jgi:uncharacterized integral membrane protein